MAPFRQKRIDQTEDSQLVNPETENLVDFAKCPTQLIINLEYFQRLPCGLAEVNRHQRRSLSPKVCADAAGIR